MAITIISAVEALNLKNADPSVHILLNGTSATVYTGSDIPAPEPRQVIALPAHVAKIMLLRSGYLDSVQSVINSLGVEATISFDSAPEIHSDNELVDLVLTNIGLNQDQIYNLFLSAQKNM